MGKILELLNGELFMQQERKTCTVCYSPITREHRMYYFLKGYLEATRDLPEIHVRSTKEFARQALEDVEAAHPEDE